MVKKTLILSLLLVAAMVGPAVALDIPELYTTIQVNPGLRGNVLLAYLYDVRALDGVSQKTLINIVNTDPNYGIVARVRFREYKRSTEVLDFHIPLTAGDVWSAEVYQCASNGTAYIYAYDPAHPIHNFNAADVSSGNWPLRLDLQNYDPVNPCPDTNGPDQGKGIAFQTLSMDVPNVARTLYGYFEIIGEERVSGEFSVLAAANPDGTWGVAPEIGTGVACGPGFTGLPLDVCGRCPQNSLFSETWLVRVEDGTAQQYQDTAISNFTVNTAGIAASVSGVTPNLQNDAQGQGLNPGFGGLPQLESVLSKRNIFVQYWDDYSNFGARTSAVVTFPTKWAHFTPGSPCTTPTRPFVGPCETIQDTNPPDAFLVEIWDRDEHLLTPPSIPIIFSPHKPGKPLVTTWPFEVNIMGIYDVDRSADLETSPPHSISDASIGFPLGDIFRDNLLISTFLGATVFKTGWLNIDLAPDASLLPAGVPGDQGDMVVDFNFFLNPASATNYLGYRGLPAIGGVLTEVSYQFYDLNYRTAVPWAYAVDWPWHPGLP